MDKPNISLAPDVLLQISGFNITSGHVTMLLISLFIIVISLFITATAKLKPTKSQVVFEFIIMWFWEKVDLAFSNKKVVKRIFPLIMTMFLLIIIANLFSLIPVLESIKIGGKSLFRTPTSDISMVLSLGLFVILLANLVGFIKSPIGQISKYFNLKGFFKIKNGSDLFMAVLNFILSLMDIISEVAKVISMSFRLFGNIFAGVAIAAVFAFLAPYLVPIPFFALGMFGGVIQAIVFSLLALQFLSMQIEDPETE